MRPKLNKATDGIGVVYNFMDLWYILFNVDPKRVSFSLNMAMHLVTEYSTAVGNLAITYGPKEP